ncbi:unnamed protein product [Sphagnum balticum]
MAGPQQQTKRGAENEAQPAPVAKRVTQETEEDNDIQDAGAVQPPSPEQTNHEEVQVATNQEEAPPPAGDEAQDASEDLEQAAKEVMANEGEPEEDLKEATEETSHENDQTKVSHESVQNGVMHTSVEEDANEPGKVVKEINTVASTVAV